jgi:hypothetical protein
LCRVHDISLQADSGPAGTTVRVGIVRAETVDGEVPVDSPRLV